MYESKANLKLEYALADQLAGMWRCAFRKLPIRYGVDYIVMRDDQPRAFCELKVREYEMDQLEILGGFMLSLGKWMEGQRLHQATQLPFIVGIQLLDGIWYHQTTDFKFDGMKIAGRTDRGDWQDVEPCILLQRDKFVRLI
jgi:hypothetical protein